LAEGARPAAHLDIGRRLLSRLQRQEVKERIFEVVAQMNRGVALVADAAERESLCRLDVLAGKRAKASAAYASARRFLDIAASLVPPDAWSARYDEAFALSLELAECEYLVGNYRRADEILDGLLKRAGTQLEK
jgi:predicted ATPase